jgi:hypothetical protein
MRESSEEAQADAKSSQAKSSLQHLVHQSWAHLLRLYDLRFTIQTHGLLNPRFIPGVTELNDVMVLLHALVVTCVNKDMVYPAFYTRIAGADSQNHKTDPINLAAALQPCHNLNDMETQGA